MSRSYGLPKVHKPGIPPPTRSILSFVNSPTDAISGYLARILSPVIGSTDYTVKNCCEFANFIRDKTLNACEELLSFDVVSLFTKIPVDLAVEFAEERLREVVSRTKNLFCLWRILFICSLFASKPRNFHTTALTINKFLEQLWVRPSLLSCQCGYGRVKQRALATSQVKPLF